MKATEQSFLAVLFITLYKVALTFEPVDEILKCNHSMKATEQFFLVILFIVLYKAYLTFESVDEEHSNESCLAQLAKFSNSAVIFQ